MHLGVIMKKVIIAASLLGIIGITGVVLLNKKESEAQSNSIDNLVNPNSQGKGTNRTNSNGVPLLPDNKVMINPNMPSPEGTNRLPKIIPPGNLSQIRVGAPPEARFMNDCQALARGNHEVMRKCFEARIQSNLVIPVANADVAKYNQKVAYCKNQSGNNLSAYQLCLNGQVNGANALSQEQPSTTFVNAKQTGQNKQPVASNSNAIFK